MADVTGKLGARLLSMDTRGHLLLKVGGGGGGGGCVSLRELLRINEFWIPP